MDKNWINSSNVLLVVRDLLNLDRTCIRERFQADAADWVMALKRTRQQYLACIYQCRPVVSWEEREQCLAALVAQVREFWLILSSEAQSHLVARLVAARAAEMRYA